MTGMDAGGRGRAAQPGADARLDALDAAAVGLLEPLIGATDLEMVGAAPDGPAADGEASPAGPTASGGWRVGLASALDRLAEAALALELIGLGHVVGLLRAHLLGVARPEDAALELALAEGWVSDAIAFCSGQLPVDEAASLIERLRDWPGLAARITPELVAPIAGRLRQDAGRIAAATLADLESGASTLSVGADELSMLAEAAEQLDEEFGAALTGRDRPAGAAAEAAANDDEIAESLELGADAIERYASAVGYVGLAPVAGALETLHGNLLTLAREPAGFDARHRALLARVAPAWARLFREPSAQAAGEALALLGDAAWPAPAGRGLIDSARRLFDSLSTVASRRVVVGDE
ncbi:MAG: hypothetical protein EHM83_04815, partial [Burkholderiales bacterium]